MIRGILKRHPVVKGMLSYAIIWPIASIAQQTIDGRRWDTYDWKKCLRITLYGTLYVAPTCYCWIKVSSAMFPKMNFRSSVAKVLVEAVTYSPFAMGSFFFFMGLLEGKTARDSVYEMSQKFWPTYQVGVCFWSAVQLINFSLIPESNRVPFISLGSLVWTMFLAYMKQQKVEEPERRKKIKTIADVKHGH